MITAKEFVDRLGLSEIADNLIRHPKSGSDFSILSLLERFDEMNDIKSLQHHKDTSVGLWATDRPDLITEKEVLFELK